jgi:hypothetical protein
MAYPFARLFSTARQKTEQILFRCRGNALHKSISAAGEIAELKRASF